jgi:hypothetical protein
MACSHLTSQPQPFYRLQGVAHPRGLESLVAGVEVNAGALLEAEALGAPATRLARLAAHGRPTVPVLRVPTVDRRPATPHQRRVRELCAQDTRGKVLMTTAPSTRPTHDGVDSHFLPLSCFTVHSYSWMMAMSVDDGVRGFSPHLDREGERERE